MNLRHPAVYYGWIIVGVAFTIRLIASGVQNTLGVFIVPLHLDFGWDIASISLASSISLVAYALTQPFVGKMTDSWGAKKVIVVGALLICIGQMLLFYLSAAWQLYFFYGVLVGVGSGAASLPTVVVVTNWFKRRRGLAVSIANSAIGAGFPTITMLALFTIYLAGWRLANLVIGLVALAVILPVSLLLVKEKPVSSAQAATENIARDSEERATSFRSMLSDKSFWLITLPYGICGFTVSLVSVHLVPLAVDDDVPELTAGGALGVLGLFMMMGLIFAGIFADRISKKSILILSYATRGLAFFLLLGHASVFGIYAFAAIFGFVELATIPATTLLCRERYGAKSIGLSYGLLMFSHQFGGAISSYLGGLVVDATGSYSLVVMMAITLSFLAAAGSVLIDERSNMLILLKKIVVDRLTPELPKL